MTDSTPSNPPPDAPEDRRRFHRVPVNFLMRFKRWTRPGTEQQSSAALQVAGTDISEEGVGGVIDEQSLGELGLMSGDRMMVEIELEEGGEVYMAAAVVAWQTAQQGGVNLRRAGFRFERLSDETRQALRKLAFRDRYWRQMGLA